MRAFAFVSFLTIAAALPAPQLPQGHGQSLGSSLGRGIGSTIGGLTGGLLSFPLDFVSSLGSGLFSGLFSPARFTADGKVEIVQNWADANTVVANPAAAVAQQ